MEFDWADGTMHAGYSKKWLTEILKARGGDPQADDEIREECGALVEANVKTATADEIAALKARSTRDCPPDECESTRDCPPDECESRHRR